MPSAADLMHNLAHLARLRIAGLEKARTEREFRAIVEFVGAVEKTRAESEPLTQTITGVRHVLREDEIVASNLADDLLAQAPESDRGLVKVPPVF